MPLTDTTNNSEYFYDYLPACMQAAGYTASSDGVCNGFAFTGMMSFFRQEFLQFTNLVKELEHQRKTNAAVFLEQLQGIHQKSLTNQNVHRQMAYTDKEKKLASWRAWFENIELSFQPFKYAQWFIDKQFVNQEDGETIASLLDPETEIKKISAYSGMYTIEEFTPYISTLMALAAENKVDFALQLNSAIHATSLLYEANTRTWSFIDANNKTPVIKLHTAEDIAHTIFASLADGHNNLGMYTAMYGLQKNEPQLLELMHGLKNSVEYKKAHEVTKERADRRTARNDTLVYLAAQTGDTALITTLHDVGADFNVINTEGGSPGHVAAQNGYAKVIRLLHEYKADLSISDNDGSTPALMAVKNGHENVLMALHAANVDLTVANKHMLTPAMTAISKDNGELVIALTNMGVDFTKDIDLACIAAGTGCVNSIAALHFVNANLNAEDIAGLTPAIYAIKYDFGNALTALHQAGVDLTKPTKLGSLASFAVRRGKPNAILALHNAGVDFNTEEIKKLIPAQISKGAVATLKALTGCGVDLTEMLASNNKTPLELATENNQPEVIHFLKGLYPRQMEPITKALHRIEAELGRLNKDQQSNTSWINFNVIKASDRKIKVLTELKQILMDNIPNQTTQGDIQSHLFLWKEKNQAILDEKRNKLHAFFMPNHQTRSSLMVEEVFRMFDMDEFDFSYSLLR